MPEMPEPRTQKQLAAAFLGIAALVGGAAVWMELARVPPALPPLATETRIAPANASMADPRAREETLPPDIRIKVLASCEAKFWKAAEISSCEANGLAHARAERAAIR